MEGKEASTSSFQMKDVKSETPPSSSSDSSNNLETTSGRRSMYGTCVTAVDLINHILIVGVTVFLLYYSMRSFGVTDLHVTLCTVGYVLLMSEAIVVLADGSSLTNFLTRRAKSHVHWILQLLGAICVVAGIVPMYQAKTFHFQSIHAILGIASTVIMLFLVAFGYPVFVAAKLRAVIRPVVIKFSHNFLGISCFVLGMASQCYGYKKSWLTYVSHVPNIQLICIVVTALITILSLRGALPTLFKQFMTMFR
ncbi:probable transmembrane reductase CYB561D1 [Osmia bicornis bicornis]|uniref:probable transmembrane reductase CYB561D1 n=1 Tax=Osmia bicornis bicornis TaxID=1437191 RepID=UPI0010F45FF1|nr:probable transmembrane reductase CYB561D1 [Osmia bicornis bicornis]